MDPDAPAFSPIQCPTRGLDEGLRMRVCCGADCFSFLPHHPIKISHSSHLSHLRHLRSNHGTAELSTHSNTADPMSKAIEDYHHFKLLSSQQSTTDGQSGAMLRRILSKGRKPRICVVGAGVAGLRCAQVLVKGGCDVTILEARDRVGGRVGTLPCDRS